MPTRVYYHFHDLNQRYRDNLVFFLATGWRRDLDIRLITTAPLPFELPAVDNITVQIVENHNQDYGGLSAVLRQERPTPDVTRILLNCSVRGPFPGDDPAGHWVDRLTGLLTPDTPLVGASIGLPRAADGSGFVPHVQSYCYAISPLGFDLLCQTGLFAPRPPLSRAALIDTYELGLSRCVQAAGYRIDCLLPKYRGRDFAGLTEDPNSSARHGDPITRRGYFGRSVTPQEVLFFKTERALCSPSALASATIAALSAQTAPELASWSALRDLSARAKRTCRGLSALLADTTDRIAHSLALGKYRSKYAR